MRNNWLTLVVLLTAAACSRRPSDEVIATQIKAKFFGDALVRASAVAVSVAQGEVTLSGSAASHEVELQAFQLTVGTAGVRRIRDRIVVADPAPLAGRGAAAGEHQADGAKPAPRDGF